MLASQRQNWKIGFFGIFSPDDANHPTEGDGIVEPQQSSANALEREDLGDWKSDDGSEGDAVDSGFPGNDWLRRARGGWDRTGPSGPRARGESPSPAPPRAERAAPTPRERPSRRRAGGSASPRTPGNLARGVSTAPPLAPRRSSTPPPATAAARGRGGGSAPVPDASGTGNGGNSGGRRSHSQGGGGRGVGRGAGGGDDRRASGGGGGRPVPPPLPRLAAGAKFFRFCEAAATPRMLSQQRGTAVPISRFQKNSPLRGEKSTPK